MQIVIDIDENIYTRLFDNGADFYDTDDISAMAKAIRKGAPLPKEHGRLIDADELEKERIDYVLSGEAESVKDCTEFGMMLIKAPTIIEAKKEMCDGKK